MLICSFIEQDCLELLNNLIRHSSSNQVRPPSRKPFWSFSSLDSEIFSWHHSLLRADNQMLLKETMGFDPLISILKIRRGSAFNFTQQKVLFTYLFFMIDFSGLYIKSSFLVCISCIFTEAINCVYLDSKSSWCFKYCWITFDGGPIQRIR